MCSLLLIRKLDTTERLVDATHVPKNGAPRSALRRRGASRPWKGRPPPSTPPGKQVAAASSPGCRHYWRWRWRCPFSKISASRPALGGGEGVPGIGKAQALPRTARSRPSCPLQLVTMKRGGRRHSIIGAPGWHLQASLLLAYQVRLGPRLPLIAKCFLRLEMCR